MSIIELECGGFTTEHFELTPAASPLTEVVDSYLKDLQAVATKYHVRADLYPWDFRGTPAVTPELVKTIEYSRTYTRGIVGVTPISLAYWEVYRVIFAGSFADKIAARAEDIKSKAVGRRRERLDELGVKIKGVPLRSLHLFDDSSNSIRAMSRTINRVEIDSGSTVTWNWLATYTENRTEAERVDHVRDREHWIPSDNFSIANMRLWKNKIAVVLKTVDIITTCSTAYQGCDPVASAVATVVSNLNANGYAVVLLHDFSTTASISYIHLFTRCFRSVKLVHTLADDRLFLCGCDFVPPPARALQKIMSGVESATVSIYSATYMATPEYLATVNTLLNTLRAIGVYRVAEYDRLFKTYFSLNTPAGKLFNAADKLLGAEYPDASNKWREATNY